MQKIAKKYSEWIKNNYNTLELARGRCQEASKKMQEAFPELRVTNGYVVLAFVGEPQMHWWCVDPKGNVVDPTAIQYVENGCPIADYEEIDDSHPARNYPRGRCLDCGEHYFIGEHTKDSNFCSTDCYTKYANYLNNNKFKFYSDL